VLRVRFHRPAPGLEQFVRFYVQREAQIRGPAVVHPVPARAAPLIEFDFGDPINVFIRLGPAFKVEDWYVRSGGRRHLLSMIRSR
jgi:hypothetical protein